MKKTTLLIGLAISFLGFMAFGLMQDQKDTEENLALSTSTETTLLGCDVGSNNYVNTAYWTKTYTQFFYFMGSNLQPVKKSQINKAKTMFDLFPEEPKNDDIMYTKVDLIRIINDVQSNIQAYGEVTTFTDEQLEMLQNSNYNEDYKIYAPYREFNNHTAIWGENFTSPHFTVVPEEPAYYSLGQDEFVKYLEVFNNEYTANLDNQLLTPAKLSFTISKNGKVTNMKTERSCGYKYIDENIKRLLKEAPGEWIPAKDENGVFIEQQLVIKYGMDGC